MSTPKHVKLRRIDLVADAASIGRSQWWEVLGDLNFDKVAFHKDAAINWGNALRAVWSGIPFVLTGDRNILNRYFDGLDEASSEILQDHAYFWVLTDSSEYWHRKLPEDRLVVLDWKSDGQNMIRDALELLEKFPRMFGLSASSHSLRREILDIAQQPTGPGCSVLILGPSGSGKEEVAQSLASLSERSGKGMQAISGAWLNMESGMSMTELVGLARGTMAERMDGLLKTQSDRTMLVDDFESAAKNVQETLLRVMSVHEGEWASFRPVGADYDLETNVWLVFATNRPLDLMLEKESLRPDFLYRFGSRVLWTLPLVERPADFPAIAHAIWAHIWTKELLSDRKNFVEPLRSDTLKGIHEQGLAWEGNVRSLASLLKLLAADMRDPALNGCSQSELVDRITARGTGHLDWIRGRRTRIAGPGRLIDQIRAKDQGHPRCQATSIPKTLDDTQLAPSEEAAKLALRQEGWARFHSLVATLKPSKRGVPGRVRLARILAYLGHAPSITTGDAEALAKDGTTDNQATVRKDLALMCEHPNPLLLEKAEGTRKHYEKNAALFW